MLGRNFIKKCRFGLKVSHINIEWYFLVIQLQLNQMICRKEIIFDDISDKIFSRPTYIMKGIKPIAP